MHSINPAELWVALAKERDNLSFSIELSGVLFTLNLKPKPIRSKQFKLGFSRSGWVEKDFDRPNTFTGSIRGIPNSKAIFYISEDILYGKIELAGTYFYIQRLNQIAESLPSSKNDYISYQKSGKDLIHNNMLIKNAPQFNKTPTPCPATILNECATNLAIQKDGVARTLEFAAEADYEYYHDLYNDDAIAAVAAIEFTIAETSIIYEEEFDLTISATCIYIWEDPNDPYPNIGSGEIDKLRIAMKNYWNNHRDCLFRDIAFLFSGRDLIPCGVALGPGSGVPRICNESIFEGPARHSYGVVSQVSPTPSPFVLAHELGHVFNAYHIDNLCQPVNANICSFPNNSAIMCGNSCGDTEGIGFTFESLCRIWTSIISLDCLDNNRSCPKVNCPSCVDASCPRCKVTTSITPSNSHPLLGCPEGETIEYTVEVCNDCFETRYMNLLIESPIASQQIIPPYTDFPAPVQDPPFEKLELNNVAFQKSECKTFTFWAKVINSGSSGAYHTFLTVEEVDGEQRKINTRIDTDFVTITGPASVSQLNNIISPQFACPTNVGQSWQVYGDLEIDEDYCLSAGSQLAMHPNASITIKSGNTLSIKKSKLFACETMWQGISLEAGATLDIELSEVSDALNAITALDGSTIRVVENTFHNNYVGLYVPSNAATNNVFHSEFYGNTFSSDESLKAPHQGSNALAGLFLNDLQQGAFGWWPDEPLPNSFINLDYGIRAINTNLFVYSNNFSDIDDVGVYTRGQGHSTYMQGTGGRIAAFNNCITGVFSSGNNIWIKEAQMDDMAIGINIRLSQNRTVNIRDNTIEAKARGIYTLINGPLDGHIEDNVVTQYASSTGSGIYMHEFSYGTGWEIQRNAITLQDGRYGLFHRGGTDSRIIDNTITVNANTLYKALYTEGGFQHVLRCNSTTGSGTAPLDEQQGIYLNNTARSNVSCNTANNSPVGINLWGQCSKTDLSANTMGSHTYGLLYGLPGGNANVTVGELSHQGNIWAVSALSTPDPAAGGAFHMGTIQNAEPNRFVVDSDENPFFFPPHAPGGWFVPDDDPEPSFSCTSLGVRSCGDEGGGGGIPHSQLDSLIATGTLDFKDFADAQAWTSARHLYRLLKAAEDELQEGSLMQQFFSSQTSTTVGAFDALQQELEALYLVDSNTIDSLNSYHSQLNGLADSLAYLDSLLIGSPSDSSLLAQRTSVQSIFINLQQNFIAFGQGIEQQRLAQIASLEAANAAISDTAVYETNQKTVNAIFLQTIATGVDTLSNVQQNQLLAIAYQCPLAGGDAVFQARSLLALAQDNSYDDGLLCQPPQLRQSPLQNLSESSGFSLQPNPARELISISFAEKAIVEGELVLYDAYGRIAIHKKLTKNQYLYVLDVSSLQVGIYVISWSNRSEHRQSQKLVISK